MDVPLSRLPDGFNFDKIAELVGLSSESHQRIKFGGVVGRLVPIAVAAVLAIGYATGHTGPNGAFFGMIAIVVIVLAVVGLALYVIATKPELAILEGLNVVRYKQLTIGAKNYSPGTELPPVPDPGLPGLPPKIEEDGE
jgi:hypothetical protein